MKFKELPEGHYYVLGVLKDTVYITKPEIKPEDITFYETDPFLTKVVHDGRSYRALSRDVTELEAVFKTRKEVRDEQRTERKSLGAKFGIVTKHIVEKKPMTGKILETALALVTCDDPQAGINKDPFFIGIAEKMKTGQPLTDYEAHIIIDVYMVHDRLSI